MEEALLARNAFDLAVEEALLASNALYLRN
jgi:hypothetical protein